MDLADSTLINQHGYASQELINIMLVGKASSNVHDNDKDLGGMILKGIDKQGDVGFLTLYEHYEYFQVGDYLKKPKLPIWIVCSESHYSILFSVNNNMIAGKAPGPNDTIDLVYYDELAKQEDDIILTLNLGTWSEDDQKKALKSDKAIVPIDSVLRTKWNTATICWNGRTVILWGAVNKMNSLFI